MKKLRSLLVLPVALAAASLAGSGQAADPVLHARVGPGFTISITNASGQRVTRVPAGSYSIDVRDLSADHNFHLSGPGGVNMSTDVATTGTATWNVTLVSGAYSYKCDAHPTTMRGAFNVGPAPPATPRLTGRVGPGKAISITKSGAAFKSIPAATYKLAVRDATKADNFHLLGPGINKRTGVKFRGSVTWSATFRAGKTYTVRSDAHPKLRRTFKAMPKVIPPPPPPPVAGL